jgi:hypothetical protein
MELQRRPRSLPLTSKLWIRQLRRGAMAQTNGA